MPLLAGVQFLIGMDENAVLIESRGYRLQTLARIVQQLLDFTAYGNELGPRSHAVRPHVHRAGVQLRGQAGHAHHEELVEIGTENGEELHALEQRVGLVLGLFEHAALKSQQTQLAIHVKRRILQIHRRRCGGLVRDGGSSGLGWYLLGHKWRLPELLAALPLSHETGVGCVTKTIPLQDCGKDAPPSYRTCAPLESDSADCRRH